MPELNLSHIDQISRDIMRQEISFSHLMDELIDHVCCDVEYEMQHGLSFSEAYKRVKQKMGPRRLREIQQETLYAVDTKYRYMKNTMKISSIAGTVLLGVGVMFKIMHYFGASPMITAGALILAFIFLPSSLVVLWKETHNKKRLLLFVSAFFSGLLFILGTLFKIQHWYAANTILVLAALSGTVFFIPALFLSKLKDQENKSIESVYVTGAFGIFFYVTGLIFKIEHWPFATILMVMGVVILGVIVFPWYTWITWKDESHVTAKFIFILVGSLSIVIPGTMINLNLQNSYDYGFSVNLDLQQGIYNYKYSNNLLFINQYRDSSGFPKMEQLHSKTSGLLNIIGNIETKMVAESEGKPGVPAFSPAQISQTEMGPEINFKLLTKPFQTAPAKDFLLPSCSARQEINKAMTEYVNYLSVLAPGENIKKYDKLLDPSTFLSSENGEGDAISLMSGLQSLELLKISILTVESHLLSSVANK
jgi:hypothetical protein